VFLSVLIVERIKGERGSHWEVWLRKGKCNILARPPLEGIKMQVWDTVTVQAKKKIGNSAECVGRKQF